MMSESKYYAKVVDNVVVRVATVSSLSYIQDNPDRYGDASLYVETVYNDVAVRGAQVGDTYDAALGFMPPKPVSTEFDSYVWNPETLNWEGR